MEFSLTAMGCVFLFLIAVGVLWMAICTTADIVTNWVEKRNYALVEQTRRAWQADLGEQMQNQSYWFHGRDTAVVSAVGKSLKEKGLYFDAQHTRDHVLPQVMKKIKAELGDHWPMVEDCQAVDFVFSGDGPDKSFVEVEDQSGKGVRIGKWLQREDGLSALRVYVHRKEVSYGSN